MSLLNWIGLGKDLSEPIRAIGDLYTTDKERLEAEEKLQEVIQPSQIAQNETNKLFATSKLLFNSGWIPLLGWTSGFLILLFYAPQIVIIAIVWGRDCIASGKAEPFPMSPDDILNLVYLLFGIGGLGLFKGKINK